MHRGIDAGPSRIRGHDPGGRWRLRVQETSSSRGGKGRAYRGYKVDLPPSWYAITLPISTLEAHSLTICTAQPGTPDADRLQLLASWAATGTRHRNNTGGRAPSP